MDNERRYTLEVAGIVQDVYVVPFNLMRQATGYVSMDTLRWMGESPYYNRLDIVVSDNKFVKEHVLAGWRPGTRPGNRTCRIPGYPPADPRCRLRSRWIIGGTTRLKASC